MVALRHWLCPSVVGLSYVRFVFWLNGVIYRDPLIIWNLWKTADLSYRSYIVENIKANIMIYTVSQKMHQL